MKNSSLETAAEPLAMVHVVHGTWGSRSGWTREGQSPLIDSLRQRFGDSVRIARLSWSGANHQAARRKAAAELAQRLAVDAEHGRDSFVIAHSHGGNVALQAINLVGPSMRERIHLILLATPFLVSQAKHSLSGTLGKLPDFISNNVQVFCTIAFWFTILGIGYKTGIFKEGLLTTSELMLNVVLFFGPPIFFLWLSNRVGRWVEVLENAVVERKEGVPVGCHDRVLVVTYPQDEAYVTLSLLANLLAFSHQLFFSLVDLIFRGLRRSGVGIFSGVLMVLMNVLIVAPLAIVSLGYIAYAIADVLGYGASFEAAVGGAITRVSTGLSSWLAGVVVILLGIAYLSGLLLLLVVTSLWIVGACRYAIFRAAGLIELGDPNSAWVDSIIGGVSVTSSPEGKARTLQIPSKTGFKHSKIYNDIDAIAAICSQIADWQSDSH